MFTLGTVIAPTATTPLTASGVGNAIWIGSPASRLMRSVPFWRICPTAKEVSSIATSGAPRIGRYAIRSMRSPMTTVPRTMSTRAAGSGSPANRAKVTR